MRKREKSRCEECRLEGSNYCRECYNFGLWTPREKLLDSYLEASS